MKVLVGAFNQEKALVGALSVIVKTGCGTDGALHSTTDNRLGTGARPDDRRRPGPGIDLSVLLNTSPLLMLCPLMLLNLAILQASIFLIYTMGETN